MNIRELAERISSGEIDAVEHTHQVLKEAKLIDKEFNYFNTFCEDRAIKAAESADGRLAGVPISVKDSIVVKDVESTAGSAILKGYIPLFNATCVQKAEDEGAVIIGKSSQDEFGFGSFSVNIGSGLKKPLNPIDPSRSCGGSSGGAAGFARKATFPTLSYGESTGGSIVVPASFCGVFGMCPTYGRVSRYGLIDYGNSLDKVGPLSKYIEDIALGLEVMSGYDSKDSTSVKNHDKSFSDQKSVKGLKIGVISEAFGQGTSKDVQDAVWEGVKKLEDNGASYDKVKTPLAIEKGLAVYYILATSEASTNLAKYCGMRYGAQEETNEVFNEYFKNVRSRNLGDEAKRRIILGTFARMAGVRDAYYLKAAKVRTLIIEEYKKLFKRYDVLICPTTPYTAPTFKEIEKLTPLQNYMADLMTVSPNLAGIPHMNIPVSEKKGLPVGMMAISDHFNEGELIRTGAEFR